LQRHSSGHFEWSLFLFETFTNGELAKSTTESSTTHTLSVCKSFKQKQTPFKMSAAMPLQPPQPLTTGMPDPSTISKQKDAYMKMLDEQFKQGTHVLDAQTTHQKDYLKSQADQQKKQFIMQIDMEVKQQEMALEQQRQEQLMTLQVQSQQQKSALEQQAMQLSMEYQQKKAEEEVQKQQYVMEKQQQEMQRKMAAEMEKFNTGAAGSSFQGLQMNFGATAAPTVPAGGQVYT
jgi:septal ring factor EnvC (AmiA/AmiB activator)